MCVCAYEVHSRRQNGAWSGVYTFFWERAKKSAWKARWENFLRHQIGSEGVCARVQLWNPVSFSFPPAPPRARSFHPLCECGGANDRINSAPIWTLCLRLSSADFQALRSTVFSLAAFLLSSTSKAVRRIINNLNSAIWKHAESDCRAKCPCVGRAVHFMHYWNGAEAKAKHINPAKHNDPSTAVDCAVPFVFILNFRFIGFASSVYALQFCITFSPQHDVGLTQSQPCTHVLCYEAHTHHWHLIYSKKYEINRTASIAPFMNNNLVCSSSKRN